MGTPGGTGATVSIWDSADTGRPEMVLVCASR